MFQTRTRVLHTHSRVLRVLLRAEMIIRYRYMLLYIMKIMNKNIVSLIFNKILCYLKYIFVIYNLIYYMLFI